MTRNVYDVGDRPEVRGAFTSRRLTKDELRIWRKEGTIPAGIGVDPAGVVCTVLKPDDTTFTADATGSDGVYTAKFDIDEAGVWIYAFDGEGGHKASGELSLEVRERAVPRG